ncbi:cytidylyltransferase domain-containing protein [Microbacterium sp. HJ5]
MTLAVVQARMSSSRLPGKVVADVEGRPMILRQLERVRAASLVSDVVVATSVDASDDPLVDLLADAGVTVHRGSLSDVLDRYLGLARLRGVDRLLRLTADCPLTDPAVIDSVVQAHEESGTDYASNVLERTFPRGLDVESVTTDALERVAAVATPAEREHVTQGIYRRPESFTLTSVTQHVDNSHLRWTVDLPADLEFVRAVYRELGTSSGLFGSEDILELIRRRPELAHSEPAAP